MQSKKDKALSLPINALSAEKDSHYEDAAEYHEQRAEDSTSAEQAEYHHERAEDLEGLVGKADRTLYVEYADPGYREDGIKRYPIDIPERIKAAWNYIHCKANADKYTTVEVNNIKRKIVKAWKREIDEDGPSSGKSLSKSTAYVSQDTRLARSTIRLYRVCKSKLGEEAGTKWFLNIESVMRAHQGGPSDLPLFLLELMDRG